MAFEGFDLDLFRRPRSLNSNVVRHLPNGFNTARPRLSAAPYCGDRFTCPLAPWWTMKHHPYKDVALLSLESEDMCEDWDKDTECDSKCFSRLG